jgi:hypothetical protein
MDQPQLNTDTANARVLVEGRCGSGGALDAGAVRFTRVRRQHHRARSRRRCAQLRQPVMAANLVSAIDSLGFKQFRVAAHDAAPR